MFQIFGNACSSTLYPCHSLVLNKRSLEAWELFSSLFFCLLCPRFLPIFILYISKLWCVFDDCSPDSPVKWRLPHPCQILIFFQFLFSDTRFPLSLWSFLLRNLWKDIFKIKIYSSLWMPAMHSLFELLIAERKYGSCVRKWTKTGTTRQSGKLKA